MAEKGNHCGRDSESTEARDHIHHTKSSEGTQEMKPQPRVFTRDNPCTKLDIWNCFKSSTGFARVDVPTAQSLIGVNVPRVMERNGYLVVDRLPQGDFYTLTEDGQKWVTRGIISFIKNHPSRANELAYPIAEGQSGRRRRARRTP